MSNLIDIQGQIEKLQKQANDIKAKEFDKTVREIAATMLAFGITVKDLQSATLKRGQSGASPKLHRGTGKPARARTRTSVAVAAKYRGPNGETWSGRGLKPRWLTALLAEGRQKEEFVIKD